MSMNWKDRWSIGATMVADAFIDEYMAGAKGEYVKVYLYIRVIRAKSLPWSL